MSRKRIDPTRMLKPGNVIVDKIHIKEYAKHYAEDMIDILNTIARDENNYARDRIQAAEAIINRAWGRAPDAKNIEDDTPLKTIDVEKLSTEELMQMIADIQLIEDVQNQKLLDAPKEAEIVELKHD